MELEKKYLGVKIIKAEPMDERAFALTVKKEGYANPESREGYKVTYENGYVSWSPKAVFEEAYREIDGLTFGLAIEAMKKGFKVHLPYWKDDVVIGIQFPDENSKMTHPYFYVVSRHGLVPWIPTMVEIFSEKWIIFE